MSTETSPFEPDDVSDEKKPAAVGSVVKAFTIVEALAEEEELGVTQIARRTNLNKATVYRLLWTLKELGYLRQDRRADKYRLSYKLMAIASRITRSQDFVTVARPVLERLASEFRETVHLCVLDGTDVVHIDNVPAPRSLSFSVSIGSRDPAHSNALGKVLLAYLSDEEIDELYGCQEELTAYTDNTIRTLSALKDEIRNVRLTGIAYDNEEHEIGLCCMGVAIEDGSGNAIAAISIAAPCARIRGETFRKAKSRLFEASREISSHLAIGHGNHDLNS